MNYSSIAQFALLVISFGIFFTYTQPVIGEIKTIQDETFAYTDAVNKASEFNAKLSDLVSRMNSFRTSDVESLETYLPDEVDELTVLSDIETVARKNDVRIVSMAASKVDEAASEGEVNFEGEIIELPKISSRDFEVSLSAPYENIKQMLRDLEQNKYLLEVVAFDFGAVTDTASVTVSDISTDGTYTMVLRAYAYTAAGTASVVGEDEVAAE
jgi:hypothetical protein